LNPLLVAAIGLGAIAAGIRAAGAAPPLPIVAWTVPLSVLAAVAEEALFRRFVYAELARVSVALAVGGSALLFALVHLPVYGAASFPLDLGAGLLLSWQRWASGTWTVPAASHAAANLLAVIR
jgi:membrane protease YdiL (CAAX protease family)